MLCCFSCILFSLINSTISAQVSTCSTQPWLMARYERCLRGHKTPVAPEVQPHELPRAAKMSRVPHVVGRLYRAFPNST